VLSEVIAEGTALGEFHPADPAAAVMRLASLLDGLAIQLALGDAEMTPDRLAGLWWQAAVLELGLQATPDPETRRTHRLAE
jgi:hypothetical protein